MSRANIPVTKPFLPELKDFIPYLEQIWDNRWLTNGGPFHQRLEAELCEHLGVEYISLFNNATIALITALKSMQITGEVITTPYSFIATSHSILWNGLKPVFVDIDPKTFNIDPAKIEAAITPHTTAILPVHCYSNPCDVEAIKTIADKYALKVIYDAAHAFGVDYKGRSILNWGDLSILSFHATKVFNTFEGGAIICPDANTKKVIDQYKNFGIVDELTVSSLGINGKMSEINSAFGLLQLKHINEAISQRQLIDRFYHRALMDIEGITLYQHNKHATSNYSYFPVIIEDSYHLTRDQLYNKLIDNNVYSRRYFYPLISNMPMYSELESASVANLPISNRISDRILCLPIFSDMTNDELERVVDVIKLSK